MSDTQPRFRRGWRILLADAGIVALLGLGLTALDSYQARKAELAEMKSSCEDRLIELIEAVSERARIVQLVRDGKTLNDQMADSDISSTAGWNKVLHGCLSTDLFDVEDNLWGTFPEVRRRSDEAFGQPAAAALTHLTDANNWALFALDQVRQAPDRRNPALRGAHSRPLGSSGPWRCASSRGWR